MGPKISQSSSVIQVDSVRQSQAVDEVQLTASKIEAAIEKGLELPEEIRVALKEFFKTIKDKVFDSLEEFAFMKVPEVLVDYWDFICDFVFKIFM